jgi:hypothetical protein
MGSTTDYSGSNESEKAVGATVAKIIYANSLPIWSKEKEELYLKKYKSSFRTIKHIAEGLGASVEEYVRGAYSPRWSEIHYPHQWTAKSFVRQWAVDKFEDYQKLGDRVNPVDLERMFILRSKAVVLNGYFDQKNGLVPQFCLDVLHKVVSIAYLAALPDFWYNYHRLSQDLKDEYFYEEELYNLEKLVKVNPQLIKTIRS